MADAEEKGIELDTETITWLVAAGIIVVFILGVLFYYRALGGIGVGFIQSIVNLPEAILNGLSGIITSFFHYLEHFL